MKVRGRKILAILAVAVILMIALTLHILSTFVLVNNQEYFGVEEEDSVSNIIGEPQSEQAHKTDSVSSSTNNTQNEQNRAAYWVSPYGIIEYINNYELAIIRDAYESIEWDSDFVSGDVEVYNQYVTCFRRLLECETTFLVKRSMGEFYINEYEEMNYAYPSPFNSVYGGMSNTYDPNDYVYYFFDIDNDGAPELCITDEVRFIYIMKYCPDENSFVMWHEVYTTWTRLLGSRKLWFYSGTAPSIYAFIQLDQNGDKEFSVYFRREGYPDIKNDYDCILYMVSLPVFAECSNNIKPPESMKSKSSNLWGLDYYRVTEQQFDELTNGFFQSRDNARKDIEKVRFSYEELFGLDLIEKN